MTTSAGGDEGLVRGIGLWTLAASAVNLTVGAGIFVLPGTVAAMMGPAGLLAYAVCAVAFGLVVLCLAECGSRVTRSGGPVAYVGTAFGPFAEFVIGMLLWAAWGLGSDAAVSAAFADLVAAYVPAAQGFVGRLASLVVVLGGLTWLNIVGVRTGVRFATVLTLIKIAPLLALIALGLPAVQPAHLHGLFDTTLAQLGATSLVLFFAFSGSETALVPGGEIERPGRVVPIAILVGLGAVLTIYGGLQLVAQGVLGPALVQARAAPLAAVAERLAGAPGRSLLLAGGGLSMFALLSGDLLANPRAIFALARSGLLPGVLGRVHPRYRTPWVAIVLYAVLTLALATSSAFETLARAASVSILLIYAAVAAATIELRRRDVRTDVAPLGVPGGITVPVLALVVVGWLLAQTPRAEALGLTAVTAILVVAYGVRRALAPSRANG
jgi:amino acid transporter